MRTAKKIFVIGISVMLMTACAAPTADAELRAAEATPFPMANGVFTGAPADFFLSESELGGLYSATDPAVERPNSEVLTSRPDGEAYIEATGRITGWRIQFNRTGETSWPLYVLNIVNTYSSAEGAHLTLNREWHADVWSLIDSGDLTLLPEIAGLNAEHLVWQDAAGTIGVEIIYRNLYIFLTGPTEGEDQYQFFADLAKAHIEWIMAGE